MIGIADLIHSTYRRRLWPAPLARLSAGFKRSGEPTGAMLEISLKDSATSKAASHFAGPKSRERKQSIYQMVAGWRAMCTMRAVALGASTPKSGGRLATAMLLLARVG
jgi:hypothetical protein